MGNRTVHCAHEHEGWARQCVHKLTFVWREAHHLQMATCPNWVLSYAGKAMASPNPESPGCRWCHEVGLTPPVASDSALRSEKGEESEVRVHPERGVWQSEGNRKGATRMWLLVRCLACDTATSEVGDAEGQAERPGFQSWLQLCVTRGCSLLLSGPQPLHPQTGDSTA